MSLDFKAINTTQAKIDNGTASPKKKGQIIFAEDSCRLYWDISNSLRKEITDLIRLNTDAQRSTITPIEDKFYLTKDTMHLWVYSGGLWYDLTAPSGVNIQVSSTAPAEQNEGDFWLEILK